MIRNRIRRIEPKTRKRGRVKSMINVVKTRNFILASLAVLGIASFIAWWLLSSTDNSSQISAEELLFTACENTVETDFDFQLTIHGNRNLGSDPTVSSITYEVQVSGEDLYMYVTDGEYTQEVISVDGTVYHRAPGEQWKLGDPQPKRKMNIAHMLSGGVGAAPTVEVKSDNPLCPEIGPVARVDEEMVNEIGTDHYRLTETGANDGLLDITWDYWVNDDGQLLKTQEVITLTDNTEAGQVMINTVVSNVGEPNVIERPPGV